MGPRKKAQDMRDSWLTPRPRKRTRGASESWFTPPAFGPGPESPWTAGRPRGPSDQSTSGPEELVETAGPPSWAGIAWDSWSTPQDFWSWAGVARDSWSTPRAFGPNREGPGTAARHRGHRTLARFAQDTYLTPQALRHGPVSPGRPGRTRGLSDQSVMRLGGLVEPAGPRTRARVSRDSCSTRRGLGLECESPGTAG